MHVNKEEKHTGRRRNMWLAPWENNSPLGKY